MKLFLSVFLGVLVLTGCGGASPQPLTAAQQARANARAAVTVAASAFVLTANACMAAAQAADDVKIVQKCADVLDPAHDLIAEAAQAVDANWSPVMACNLVQAVKLTTQAATALGVNIAVAAPVLQDAALLAQQLSGAVCATDGGAE